MRAYYICPLCGELLPDEICQCPNCKEDVEGEFVFPNEIDAWLKSGGNDILTLDWD